MKKAIRVIMLGLLIGAGGFFLYQKNRESGEVDHSMKLYGNVDQRQVELGFIDSERISEVLVEEGDKVVPGQVLARQETRRLRDKIVGLEAQVKVAEVVLGRLKNGTRPEEIERARSAVAAAEADLEFAMKQHERYLGLWKNSQGVVSERDVEEREMRAQVARETLTQRKKELDLAIEGPRKEDIAEAEAVLSLNNQNLAELKNRLSDAELKSPSHAVVRSRLQEPGDITGPQRPVFSLAVTSPKWVRVYASEVELGYIRPGMEALVYMDSYPGEGVPGKVGFISSVAEFTPKTVQTEELRTSLVYEVRVYVSDEADRLRLGMPVTVVLEKSTE